MKVVLRREEKFAISSHEVSSFSSRLMDVINKDKHSQNGSYMVRSLYFDTIDDNDFFDKINEQEIRRKIRLRIYNPSAKTVKLELKQKQGVYQKKTSLTISRKDADALIACNFSVLLKYNDPFADKMFTIMSMECYRPKAIVEYNRTAYMAKENQIRLTFDENIRASESNLNLFDNELQLGPVFPTDVAIFEVKYDRFLLSYISDMIACINRLPVSSSKYCMGRSIGYPLYL